MASVGIRNAHGAEHSYKIKMNDFFFKREGLEREGDGEGRGRESNSGMTEEQIKNDQQLPIYICESSHLLVQ